MNRNNEFGVALVAKFSIAWHALEPFALFWEQTQAKIDENRLKDVEAHNVNFYIM